MHHRSLLCFAPLLLVSGLLRPATAGLLHSYDLTSSFNDQLGGPSLTHTGALTPGAGYTFASGQAGLTLSSALPDPADYSIRMVFELNTLSNGAWSNILNFHNADHELYDFCGGTDNGATIPCALQLYPDSGGTGAGILANTFVDLLFTRDSGTNTVNAWLGNTEVYTSLNDTEGRGIFSDPNNIIRFFQDENSGTENSPGTVKLIQIYSGNITPADEVNGLLTATPEPGSYALLGLAALGLGYRRRKR